MSDNPRIYVASLSDYNNGRLHGVWIDATDDDIHEQVQAMLAKSPTFREFPAGGPAEEWAIHDHDNFGGWNVSEWASFDRVHEVATAMVEHGIEAVAGYLISYGDDADLDEFTDHYRGVHESFKDYILNNDTDVLGFDMLRAELKTGQTWDRRKDEGIEEMISKIEGFIDWDAVARDYAQDYTTHRGDEGLHIYQD